MREGHTEIDSMLEALRLTASGIIDKVQGIKTTQSGLLERIIAMEARLQNALVGVNKNFMSMSNDIKVQHNIINKLVGTMNQWEWEQKVLHKDVDQGQRWSQQLENGTMGGDPWTATTTRPVFSHTHGGARMRVKPSRNKITPGKHPTGCKRTLRPPRGGHEGITRPWLE